MIKNAKSLIDNSGLIKPKNKMSIVFVANSSAGLKVGKNFKIPYQIKIIPNDNLISVIVLFIILLFKRVL